MVRKILLLIALINYALFIFLPDVFGFHECLRNDNYHTPWYSTNWFKALYTNIRIRLNRENSYIYETYNGVGDKWICRETKFGRTKFWTTLKEYKKKDLLCK